MQELSAHRLTAVAVGPFLLLIIAIAFAFVGRSADATHEPGHGGMQAMSIDLDVTGNTATTIGPRDDCIQVSPGDTVTIDVTAEGIPAAYPMIAFGLDLIYDPALVSVLSSDANFLLAALPGSELFDVAEPTPDADGRFNASAADIGSTDTVSENGSGVLRRVTISIAPHASPGFSALSLSGAAHVDPNNEAWAPHALHSALLAVGSTCEAAPTLAPTGLPTITPGVTPPLTPTPTVAPPTTPPPTNGGMQAMSIDLDVTGNSATSLGPRDNCILVSPGDVVTLDVTAEGIPATNPMIAFAFELGYAQSVVRIETGSADYLISSKPGSTLFDASDPPPDIDGIWNASAADIGDTMTASESGLGVLIRAGLSIAPSAPPGLYPLTLSAAAHIDLLGQVQLPGALNWAYLAIGATCETLPTPPPTPAVTYPPTPAYTAPPPPLTQTPTVTPPANPVASVGIDHDGGSPDINAGPATVAAGEAVTVSVVSEAPGNLVGAYDIKVTFDPTKLAAQGCAAGPGGVCNAHAGPGEVRLSLVQILGLPSAANLMDVTFLVVASQPACVTVFTSVTTAADTIGNPLVVQAHHGQVCIDGATPPPYTPAPTAATTPAPPPGTDVLIGIDHNGAAPDINEGPVQVPIGGTTTVSVVAETISDAVGAWEIQLFYDPMIVTAIGCQGELGSVCNHNTGGPMVLIAGANVGGLPPRAAIAHITFRAEYAGNACGLLVPEAELVANTLGESLTNFVLYGRICVGGGVPAPSATPLATGALTPTPAATYPPFPSTTPGGTAGPTPPPDGVPPVFDPGGTMCWDNFESLESCDGDSAPGAASDIMFQMCVGWEENCTSRPSVPETFDSNFATMVNFIPTAFNPSGDDLPVGAISGLVAQDMVLGLLNGPCNSSIEVHFSLLNASTNQLNPVAAKAVGLPNPMAPLAADVNPQNGIPDGADRYPSFLSEYLFDLQPRERLFGATKIQGGWMTYNVLIFDPGAHIATASGIDMTFDAALGYPMLFVLDDPGSGMSPGAVTDFCSPTRIAMALLGKTYDNPCTPSPSPGGANCPGPEFVRENSGYPFLPCDTGNTADEDADGAVNDGCPQELALAESGTQCGNATSDDGEDSSVNDGCPAVGVPEYVRGGSCAGADEGGCVHHTNPEAAGPYEFTSVVTSYRDADRDGIENVLDVCAVIANSEWNPRVIDVVDDTDSDGLPNVCDPSPGDPSPLTPATCPAGILGPDEDQDCAPNRSDNCPNDNQLADPSAPPGSGNPPVLEDTDHDGIGDACDPNPNAVNGEMIGYCLSFAVEVGAPPEPVIGIQSGWAPECVGVSQVPIAEPPYDGTPVATQAAPTPTPSPTAPPPTPSPTVLSAVALPQTGGADGGTSVAQAVLVALGVIGTGGAVVTLAYRSRFGRRRA